MKKPLEITPLIQRKVENAEVSSDIESGVNSIRGGGQSLPDSIRNFFEPRFGYDFSGVRVHSDAKASELSHVVNAKAFTIGRDVVFGAGQYKPESAEGKSLLAHELTHVLQQGTSLTKAIQHQAGDANECAEKGPAAQEDPRPLIFNSGIALSLGSPEQLRSKRPAVGYGQRLLNGHPVQRRVQRVVNDDAPDLGNCPPGYTICDFIHERITVEAQYALSDMVRQGGEDCDIALSILGGVEKGQLEGVYMEDQGKPAMMARRHGTSWWELIPPGEGVIVSELESPPMMIIAKRLANNRAQLAAKIKEAWQQSSFAGQSIAPPPPKLHGCAAAPEPPPPPPPGPPAERCPYPRCDPNVPTTVWAACGFNKYGVPFECFPVAGEACGICEGGSKNAEECFKENERRHRIERQKCKDEYSPWKVAGYILFKCGPNAVKCLVAEKPIACLKMVGCFVYPRPLIEYQECLNRESERYFKEVERCRTLL